MASLSDGTSGQSKNLKKVSKLLPRASQITYYILVLIYRWIRFKKKYLGNLWVLNPWVLKLWTPTVWAPIQTSYELNSGWRHTHYNGCYFRVLDSTIPQSKVTSASNSAVGHWVSLWVWSVVGCLLVYQDGKYLYSGQYSQTICWSHIR